MEARVYYSALGSEICKKSEHIDGLLRVLNYINARVFLSCSDGSGGSLYATQMLYTPRIYLTEDDQFDITITTMINYDFLEAAPVETADYLTAYCPELLDRLSFAIFGVLLGEITPEGAIAYIKNYIKRRLYMVYVTGDTHRDFNRLYEFCQENGTTKDDVLIILGDAGINYYLDDSDWNLKWELSALEVTLFCIHGNHEERPFLIDTYEEKVWRGGVVYHEEEFPNLLFAKDGEIYDFNGLKTVVIGGAYSVDKYARIYGNAPWFESEQPSEETKDYVARQLEQAGWRVDCVLTHAAPERYEPTWAFIPGLDQAAVDKSTEKWLDSIERRLDYGSWHCGHYHVDSQEGPIRIMWEDICELE